jgi:hypothetical protein
LILAIDCWNSSGWIMPDKFPGKSELNCGFLQKPI